MHAKKVGYEQVKEIFGCFSKNNQFMHIPILKLSQYYKHNQEKNNSPLNKNSKNSQAMSMIISTLPSYGIINALEINNNNQKITSTMIFLLYTLDTLFIIAIAIILHFIYNRIEIFKNKLVGKRKKNENDLIEMEPPTSRLLKIISSTQFYYCV